MNIRCLGCMEEYDAYYDVCPHCGTVKDSPPKDASFLFPGTILHQRYMAGQSMGSGDFSVTYIGYDLVELKKVTIKEYYPRNCCSRVMGSNDLNIFEDERKEDFYRGFDTFLHNSKILSSEEIPGMVKLEDCFRENNTTYIVQEYLEGETLEAFLQENKMISMGQALEMVLPVLDVLNQLHQKDMYHFRVNPQNIFITEFGEVKLMDFGGYQLHATNRAHKVSSIDTDVYMAPELKTMSVIEEKGAADVYSVCAVLYRMLTGVEPLEGVERIHADRLVSPEEHGVRLSKTQNNVIMNGLATNPKNRTKTVGELIQQLSSIRIVERKVEKKEKISVHEPKKGMPAKLILGIGIPCLVLVLAVSAVLMMKSRKQTEKLAQSVGKQTVSVAVPNFVNTELEEAKTLAENNGMELRVTNRKNDEKVEKGIILSQSPEAGEAPENGSVSVVVSAGTDTITMIDVIGCDGKNKLAEEGYILTDEKTESYVIPGYVVELEDNDHNAILPGQEVADGCAVTVKTSSGMENINTKENVEIPKLIGLDFNEALSLIADNQIPMYIGLSDEKAYAREKDAKIGEICKMEFISSEKEEAEEVKEGETVSAGTSVILTLSKGPKPVSLPEDYQGKALSTVEKELDSLNLKYDQSKYDYIYSSQYSSGTVISITKSCSHKGLKGDLHWDDTVNITVSKGAKPVPKPTPAPAPSQKKSTESSKSSNSDSDSKSSSSDDSKKENKEEYDKKMKVYD